MKPSSVAIRHRLLEGVLLRLPQDGAFVLRGGLLLRHWFRPIPRPAEDLDLIATFPFSIEEASARILPLLAEPVDSIAFGPARVEGIWLGTSTPCVRVLASWDECEVNVDVTFGPLPRPAPALLALPTAFGEARVLSCRPESVAAQKVQGLWHRGLLGWRPKDLRDLYLLMERVPMDAADLRGAIIAYLGDMGGTADEARALFAPGSWWGMKMATARWQDHCRSMAGVPRALAEVVQRIAARLIPVLEGAE